MTTATRRLTDIKFEHEGAHVALVGKHQGGAANGYTTLVTKATDHLNPEQVNAALETTNKETPFTEEPIVETIEKSVHLILLEKAVEDAVKLEKAAAAEAVAEVSKALVAQEEVLKAAQAEVVTLKAAEAARSVELRKAALSAVVPATTVEVLMKAYAALSDEDFTAAVDVHKATKASVDASDAFVETGVAGTGEATTEERDLTAEILKAKYAK